MSRRSTFTAAICDAVSFGSCLSGGLSLTSASLKDGATGGSAGVAVLYRAGGLAGRWGSVGATQRNSGVVGGVALTCWTATSKT